MVGSKEGFTNYLGEHAVLQAEVYRALHGVPLAHRCLAARSYFYSSS